VVNISNGKITGDVVDPDDEILRKQSFRLELRSQTVGGTTLLRCISPVGEVDLFDHELLDRLYALQRVTGMSKVCAAYDSRRKKHIVTVQGDRLFDLKTTQWQEIEELVVRTVTAADQIEERLLGSDDDQRYLDVDRGRKNA